MKILVCGGRNYEDKVKLFSILDFALCDFKDLCIIQGEAKGADRYAKLWAIENGVCCIGVSANWTIYDLKAGNIRNGWMIKFCNPDMLLAFPGGKGTLNMINQARKNNIPVYEIV